MERMMQSIDELKSRQADFEKALEQKEAEKLMIYQEMIQSKHRQDVLEARMSRMVGVLMQACHSIGLTPIENGDGGNNLLQILDCDTSDSIRSPAKRPRLLENAPMSPILDKHTVPLEGLKFQNSTDAMNSIHSDSVANDLLDALSAKLSSVSGHRGDLFRSVNTGPKLRSTSKPTLEDVTDSWEVTSGFPAAGVSPLNGAGVGAATSAYVFDSASGCDAGTGSIPAEPCASAPASPRSSHELDGETGHALLLSPRAFDSMDCLPTENLNSIELNLGSQTFNLDSLLGGDAALAAKKEVLS